METVLLHKSAFLYVTSIFRLSSFVFANALLTGITKTFVPFYSSFPEILCNFVMENYKKVNSVKEFADLYYVSERSFSRKFHSCFGESPYKWMQKKRAEQMLEMICDPELSFQEISGRLGFSSPSHFTAYCRRMYGMSPTQLREKNKK